MVQTRANISHRKSIHTAAMNTYMSLTKETRQIRSKIVDDIANQVLIAMKHKVSHKEKYGILDDIVKRYQDSGMNWLKKKSVQDRLSKLRKKGQNKVVSEVFQIE